jgi:serralysin
MSYFETFQTIRTFPHLDGLRTLRIDGSGDIPVLFAGSQIDGTISSFALSSSYTALIDQMTGGPERGTNGLSDLDVLTSPSGARILLPSGRFDDALALYELPPDGTLGTRHSPAEAPAMVQKALAYSVNDHSFFVSRAWGQSGATVYEWTAHDTLKTHIHRPDTASAYLHDVTDFASLDIAGRSFVFSASAGDHGVSSFWMGQWGNMRPRDSLGAADGLPIHAPSALTTAQVDGKSFIILGAAGSGSLSVIRVNKWGGLFEVSTYLDTRDTRFDGVTALESFSVSGRSFLIAGGSDDGLSLFEINPDGSLNHLESVADSVLTTLGNVTSIAAHVSGTTVTIAVAGSETGFTRFDLDFSTLGQTHLGTRASETLRGHAGRDMIHGKDGNDLLEGLSGDDRLIDGRGADVMTGGLGADTFVFIEDRRLDRITDFTPGEDTLDLSGIPHISGMESLTFTQKLYGVLITAGDERFRIESINDTIQVSELETSDFIFDF